MSNNDPVAFFDEITLDCGSCCYIASVFRVMDAVEHVWLGVKNFLKVPEKERFVPCECKLKGNDPCLLLEIKERREWTVRGRPAQWEYHFVLPPWYLELPTGKLVMFFIPDD